MSQTVYDPGNAFGANPDELAGAAPASTSPAPTELQGAAPDVSFTPGPPLLDLADSSGAVLEAAALVWLHTLLVGVDNATGLPFDVGALIAAGGVSLAVTQGDPAASDWNPAALLRRPEGVYARILVGAGGSAQPGVGRWRVYVRLVTGGANNERRLPGYLVVE